MNSSELLDELATRVKAGELSADEVRAVIEPGKPETSTSASSLASKLSVVLYYIGGGVVFLGLVFLIAQEWRHFGTIGKIGTTLGSGIAAFVVGVLFSNQKRLGAAGPAFFLISAMLLPGGLFIAYDEAGKNVTEIAIQLQIAGVLFAAYLGAYFLFRKNVLLTFAFIFGTWFFFVLTDDMVLQAPMIDDWAFFNYRIFSVGLAYTLLGYSFVDSDRQVLTGWLYAFGMFAVLGAGFALGGWSPNQSVFWEAIYPGLVFGTILISTHIKSRIFLVFGSFALGAFLVKITAEYFSGSLGWAFSLVLVGFLLMGVAYLAVRVNRRYLK